MKQAIIIFNAFAVMSFAILFSQYSFSQSNSIISIKNFPEGNIPLTVIKQAIQLDVKPPYKLLSATVYISDSIGYCVATLALKGNVFDEDFLNHWNRLTKTSTVTFDNIKLMAKTGKIINLKPQRYKVISN